MATIWRNPINQRLDSPERVKKKRKGNPVKKEGRLKIVATKLVVCPNYSFYSLKILEDNSDLLNHYMCNNFQSHVKTEFAQNKFSFSEVFFPAIFCHFVFTKSIDYI